MTHAGPLPGLTPPRRPFGVSGVYHGIVERLDPLGVSVPVLSGTSQVVPDVSQVAGLTLAVGDRVMVSCLNGDRRQLMVTSKLVGSGATHYSGSGAPVIAGAGGDWWWRTDTPGVALQRAYICTVGGTAGVAVWAGVL